jgi:hypothetical protein
MVEGFSNSIKVDTPELDRVDRIQLLIQIQWLEDIWSFR